MALLDDIGTWLAQQGVGVFTADDPTTRTIFGSAMPDAPDLQVALFEYPGQPPEWGYDPTAGVGGALISHPCFQVQTRGAPDDYRDARDLADRAFRALLQLQAVSVNGVYYLRVRPKQEPFGLGRDQKRRPQVAFNCDVTRRMQ